MSWQPKEVVDFDPAYLDDPKYMAQLVAMVEEYQLVIIRRQHNLTVKQHLGLTAKFGTVQPSLSIDTQHKSSMNVQVMVRQAVNLNAVKAQRISSSHYWHTDRSFLPTPPAITTLWAQVLPDSGGQTCFANMINALRAVCDAGITELDYMAIHSYAAYFEYLQPAFYTRRDVRQAMDRFPSVAHPLVRVHPTTKAQALHLSELCVTCLRGLPDVDSRNLLDALYKISTTDDNVYVHSWNEGDLLIWSNFGLMHKGTPSTGDRLLRRTVAGKLTD